MIKRVFRFQSCSATAGRPFQNGPKCPLYNKTHNYLKSEGWEQMYYNPSKTAVGDLCNTKFKKLEKSSDVLGMLEVNIEGTKRTCTLTAVVSTYHPKDILKTIDHQIENSMMAGFESFLRENCGARDV